MPLLKKTPCALLEPPKDLDPNEPVYQIRFTKEIFRDYQPYLNRINLYRQRLWTCKISGKGGLTYEEALVSERRAAEKVQEIPKELVAPALRIIQFSMLSLKDLADSISSQLQKCLYAGAELQGKKGDELFPCKILKVLGEATKRPQYYIAWLDKNKKSIETAVLKGDDLIQNKLLFSRNFWKSFVRESTYRNAPWVVHDKLAEKHGISSDPPQNLEGKVSIRDGVVVNKKRRRSAGEGDKDSGKHKKKKGSVGGIEEPNMENNGKKEEDQPRVKAIKYPIDDLLIQPSLDDPPFANRPSPSRDFNVPMDCVGDLLMVWDFCSSFGRLLHLWPFSLEDFENAICHKDNNLTLIFETHSALLRLLINDGDYFAAVQKSKRKCKITLINWTDYLWYFLETVNIPDLSDSLKTIKRGNYSHLDPRAKLVILRELINKVLDSNPARDKLGECVEQMHVLGATRRGEALEEARKKRAEKERLKNGSTFNGVANGPDVEIIEDNVHLSADENDSSSDRDLEQKRNEAILCGQNHTSNESDSNHSNTALKQNIIKQKTGVNFQAEGTKDSSRKEPAKQSKDGKKDLSERKSKKLRREYFEREMEKLVLRTNPLGKDRDYNRYWWFRRDGRIFVESSDSKMWGYYSCKEEVDGFLRSLNCKGERERALQKQLEKFYSRICSDLEKRSKDLAHRIALEEAVLRRSTRVRALPRENAANAFLRYVNKWKEE